MNLIYKYEFLKNNPLGTYVIGDVLEVYFEEAYLVDNNNPLYIETTGIRTYLNSVEVFSGGFIYTTPDVVSFETTNPKYCKGTQLVKFFGYAVWPYAFYTTIPDSQECAVNPSTCDLIILGKPDTVDPSTETSSDGEITINATSTYSIQYKLNQDFYYGNGQTSNTFTGLGVGNYRIYVRDEKNCGANIFVELKYIGDYGAKFRLSYFDFVGNETTLDICERDYVGSVSEYKGTDNPVEIQLRGEGNTNKFQSIIPIQVNLGIISEEVQQYIDLYTNDPEKYRVKYYKEGVLKLTTKLLPFVYQEDYKAEPYIINVSASDGLADLSNIDFVQDDGLRLYGEVKLIKVIAYCLRFTRLGINIRVGCNIYASGMNTTSSDDPLDQAYVDMEAFYLANKRPTVNFVLSEILKPFGARVIQWDGVWNVVRVEELGASYDYREFDFNGDYVSHSSNSPVLDVDFPGSTGDVLFESFPNLELQNGYGKITVKYNLGLKPNFIYNGDFRLVSRYNTEFNRYEPVINIDGFVLNSASYPIEQRYEVVNEDDRNVALVLVTDSNSGTAFLQSQPFSLKMGPGNTVLIKIRYKMTISPGNIIPYIKLRVKVQYGSLYLTGTGEWTSTDNTLTFFATKAGEYIESEITASQPGSGTPATGMDFIITVYHAHPYYADFTSLALLRAFDSVSLPVGYKTEVRKLNIASIQRMYYYELEENTEAESGDDIVRPHDYNASTNPVQWILKQIGYIFSDSYPFYIDYIKGVFLTNGKESIDTIVRSVTGENRNRLKYEETLLIGSSGNTIVTESGFLFDYGIGILNPGTSTTTYQTITTNILSDLLIYTGYLRDSSGTPYDDWTRDGVGEVDKLHGIWLKMFAAQYSRTWRLLRASIVSSTTNITPLNSFREVNDSNRIYVPMSMTLNDRRNQASCELVETGIGGLDGVSREHSSAFSSAFS